MFRRCILIATLALPSVLMAQPDWGRELQRDMALLQDQVRVSNEKLDALTAMLQQTLDRMNGLETTVSSMEGTMTEKQRDLVAAPMAQMGSKIDSAVNEFGHVRETVADMNARLTSLQTQVTDLRTTMTVMAAAPAAPGEEPGSALPPQISADVLFSNAQRDQNGGKLDLALDQYQQFLTTFPNTDLAPAAQYAIGEILYEQADYERAREAFDRVLEIYPENEKSPDARFMKAMSLEKLGQDVAAASEFRDLIRTYPNSELSSKAVDELGRLGYSPP